MRFLDFEIREIYSIMVSVDICEISSCIMAFVFLDFTWISRGFLSIFLGWVHGISSWLLTTRYIYK